MIHCDIDDTIREIKFIQENFLLCVHNKCLNVWKLKNEDKTSTESQLLKRGGDVDGFTEIACVWSKTCDDEVVEIVENPIQKSQFILFIKTNVTKNGKNSNEQVSTEIQSKLFICLFYIQ